MDVIEDADLRLDSDGGDSDEEYVRFDVGKLGKAVETPQGGYRIPATLHRTGVLKYRNPDGSIRSEWHPPEVVFSEESLSSARLAPVTLDHPRGRTPADQMIDRKNWRRHQSSLIGWTAENVRQDGDVMVGDVVVQDGDSLDGIDSGSLGQISPAYTVRLDKRPGVTPEGEPYDWKVTRIKHNAFAIGGARGYGRQGESVGLRLDARGDGVAPYSEPNEENAPMKIRLDSKDVEVADPELAKAIVADLTRRDAALEAAKGEADAMRQKLETATKERDEAKKAAAEATAPARLDSLVSTRVARVEKARRYLGAEYKHEGKTDRQINEDVIRRDAKDLDLTKRSDEYVEARADGLLETATDTAEETQRRLDAIAKRAASGGGGTETIDDKRQAMILELEKLHETPAAKTA